MISGTLILVYPIGNKDVLGKWRMRHSMQRYRGRRYCKNQGFMVY